MTYNDTSSPMANACVLVMLVFEMFSVLISSTVVSIDIIPVTGLENPSAFPLACPSKHLLSCICILIAMREHNRSILLENETWEEELHLSASYLKHSRF